MANTPPLNPNLPMVDDEGLPTPFFMRWWQDQIDTNSTIPSLETPAQVSAVIDILGSPATWGSILFRGETLWNTLGAGTSGQVLTTGGPSANPTWTTLTIPDVLNDLSDVSVGSATDGQVLTYQVVSGVGSWVPETPATGGGGTSEVGTPNYIRNIVYAVDVSQDPDSAAIETDIGPRTTTTVGQFVIVDGAMESDGVTDYTVYPTGADLELGLRDFSIKIGKFSTPSIATTQGIASHWSSSGTQRGWIIRTSGSSINVLLSTTGSDFPSLFTGATTLANDTEYDIELRRVDGTFQLLIDGVVDATSTTSYDIHLPSSQGLEIGNYDTTEMTNGGRIQSFSLAFLNEATATGVTAFDDLSDVSVSGVADQQYLKYEVVSGVGTWVPTFITIGDLTDVDDTGATDGQVLTYEVVSGVGTWVPAAAGGGATVINDLTDVDTSTVAPTDGQVLKWSAADSEWQPADDATAAAGTPIALLERVGAFQAADNNTLPVTTTVDPTGHTFLVNVIGNFDNTISAITFDGVASDDFAVSKIGTFEVAATAVFTGLTTTGSKNVVITTTGGVTYRWSADVHLLSGADETTLQTDFATSITAAANLSLTPTENGSYAAGLATVFDSAGPTITGDLTTVGAFAPTNVESTAWVAGALGAGLNIIDGAVAFNATESVGSNDRTHAVMSMLAASDPPVSNNPTESFILAASDETTALTIGTAKVTFRMPYAFTLTDVRASLTTAGTGANLVTVDINEGGVSILSTAITIDATEKTSTTATTPAVISDTALADDAEITVDIDQIDSGGVSAGLKVTLIGQQP